MRNLHSASAADTAANLYKIKAVYLLGSGWSVGDVCEALLISEKSARHYFDSYQEYSLEGLLQSNCTGRTCRLSEEQQLDLIAELNINIYPTVDAVIDYVHQQWGIAYSESGMRYLLHQLGFCYKKYHLVPAKSDETAQEEFIERYQQLKRDKKENEPIYFMDATHPQHNTHSDYGWFKKGEDRLIESNTGRQRLNINGAIELTHFHLEYRLDDTINAQSTIELFIQLEKAHPEAEKVFVIADNARYYRAKIVTEFLQNSKIELIFLPPYSPNLNLIERYWKFFKKKVKSNRYYSTFKEFKAACLNVLENSQNYIEDLESLLTENFQIIRT
ncbi:IS630 family transposase [Ectothiorhodospiraceae bacterium BW-2]|nr:IS630 family transposase [Ectothiorhodospiraceae bacterium BW-2]